MRDAFQQMRLGILGGGQLGKMLLMPAHQWALTVSVLDPTPDCPAAHLATHFVKGDFDDYHDVYFFGNKLDLLTIEIEAVNVEALDDLQSRGVIVRPSPSIIALVQDKYRQRQLLHERGFPVPRFALFEGSASSLHHFIQRNNLSLPCIAKFPRGGYDGRGVFVLSESSQIDEVPLLLEERIDIHMEISVLVGRNASGQIAVYDPVEMVFDADSHMLDYLIAPAHVSGDLRNELVECAVEIARSVGLEGMMAVEFFVDKSGKIYVNELAPRPHNSGHHTIEGAVCSQFEQHWRMVLDLPPGDTTLRSPYVATANVVGPSAFTGPPQYRGWKEVLAHPNVHLHIYGKARSKPYRKMGHMTVLGASREEIAEKITRIRSQFHIEKMHIQ